MSDKVRELWKHIKGSKWLLGYVAALVLLLPLTIILAGQQQNRESHASAIPLTIDVQTGKNQSTTSNKITSAAFSTNSGNELVVVFLASDGSTTPQAFSSVTGGGLTFSLARRANTQKGTAEIWYAYSSSQLSNAQITATRQSGSYTGLMRVVTFTGARTVLGATASGSSATGPANVSLTTTVANSLVLAVGNDPTSAASHTVGVNQRLTQQYLATKLKKSYWTQQVSAALPNAGSLVTIDDPNPTTDAWNMVAVEVLPLPADQVVTTGGPSLAGLVAGYSFNEGSGLVAGDSSGNGNNGAVTNGSWAAGKYGSALSFTGASTVLVNNSPSIDISGSQLTLSMWVNPQQVSGDTVVLGKFWNPTMTSPYYQYGIEFQNNNTTPVFQIGTTGGVQAVSMGSTLPYGQWSHLAVVFDGSQAQFYVNGSLKSTKALAATITARGNQLRLGSDASNDQYFKGMLDEVRIYNRTLSASEVQTDMNNQLFVVTSNNKIISI